MGKKGTAKYITTRKGQRMLVDAEDYESLVRFRWSKSSRGYFRRTDCKNGRKTVYVHRLLVGVDDSSIQVDHKNGRKWDNRKSNLRVCTCQQNACNRKKLSNNTSGFKGVWKVGGKWRAAVRQNGKLIHAGYFVDRIEAARSYDRMAVSLQGDFANVNFPNVY